ncbi:MAG: TauD/TfdA dioxygenase family protein [Acidimicrobiales bacterium]
MTTISDETTGLEVDVTPLAAALGAEVRGIDLASAGDVGSALVEELLLRHQVLFFPGQHLTLDEHVALARHFGPLEAHPNLRNPTLDHPEIFELAASSGGIADEWHTDLTFLESPSVMSVLNMVTCPPVGGDTQWTNLCQAYDELSPPLRELCDGLTALHDAHPHDRSDRMAIHPVVRVHPVTGRRALYVNQHFTRRIVEVSHTESEALLGLLTSWVTQPRFTVRYRWTEGTIAIWDNRCTQHSVLNDFEGERVIQRATVMGDRPEGTGPSRWAPWEPARAGAMTRHDRQLRRFLRQGADPSGAMDT